ncbi:30S ribosomal protein S9 [Patescibacteria group bacterium]|nr:30S ribosomal protein S9 [Patescibacteria group bacterium]
MPRTKKPEIKKTASQTAEEKKSVSLASSPEKPKTEKVSKEKKVKKINKAEKVEKKKKTTKAKEEKEKTIKEPSKTPSIDNRYFEAVGRRKTSVARVRLFTKGGREFLVNDKSYNLYFPTLELQQIVIAPLERMKCLEKFKVVVLTKGGGVHSQAEAVRHGISRALLLFNPEFRKRLKKVGFLVRDSRMRERKKFGLKRARKGPQWSKR